MYKCAVSIVLHHMHGKKHGDSKNFLPGIIIMVHVVTDSQPLAIVRKFRDRGNFRVKIMQTTIEISHVLM